MHPLVETILNISRNIVAPLAASVCLAAPIGWNRERGDKPAGLRTHMMVALGAATFTMAALGVHAGVERAYGSDPTRVIVGVATGIGFLGAGSIIRTRGDVRGITTAAGIWVVGGIGAACGAKLYAIGVTVALLALIILTFVNKLEHRFLGDRAHAAGSDRRR